MSTDTADLDRVIELVEQIARPFESLARVGASGLVYPYFDYPGYPTQGWGRLLSRKRWGGFAPNSREANDWLLTTFPPITKDEAEEWLKEDVIKHLRATMRLISVPVSHEQLAALTDFAFNAGPGNLEISTLRKLVNREEHRAAADEFLKWNKAGGVVLRGLTRRCEARRAMYLSGTAN